MMLISAWTPNYGKASITLWRHHTVSPTAKAESVAEAFFYEVNMRICKVDGCTSKTSGRGLVCGNHQRRMRLYGDYNFTKNRKSGEGFYAFGYKAYQIDGVKKFEHVMVAEKAIGKHLPFGAVVHHVNKIRDDNRNSNLVICQDRAYHNLLHARIDAMEASGDPCKRKCKFCKTYDSLDNLKKGGTSYFHSICHNKNQKERRNK